jgi:predicted nucleic acid-binding protein
LIFLDTSFVARLLLAEPGSADLARRLEGGKAIATSSLLKVEFPSAVARGMRDGRLGEADAARALALFRDRACSFQAIPVSEEILDQAAILVHRRALRSLDAIQLASALSLARGSPAAVRFGSGDRRLNAAAEAEGLELLPVA